MKDEHAIQGKKKRNQSAGFRKGSRVRERQRFRVVVYF